jgi:hypothetical protein
VRRLLGMIMLVLAAGTVSPAAVAAAATQPPAGPAGLGAQRFGVRIVDVPASAVNDPRALHYIVDYLPTGTVIHRRIQVQNQQAQTAHFTVYPDAAQISKGSFIGETGAARNELTGWISVQYPALTLRPHTSAMDMITIKVPLGATRGEHYGVIWVQQASRARTAKGFGITNVARVGIRIYLAVGRGGAPPTKFAITSLTGHRSASGQPLILAGVDDTGGRAVDLHGTVRLTGGPGDTSAGPFPQREFVSLAPGQSGNMTFAPPKVLSDGPWQASVTVDSGLTTATATATIRFAAPVASQAGLPGMAWLGMAAGALALVLAVAMILVRAAHQRRRTAT